MRNAECVVRNAKCEMKMPDASFQMPEASQGAINLLTEQILKGGVPLFEERGTALSYIYSLKVSFKRAYK